MGFGSRWVPRQHRGERGSLAASKAENYWPADVSVGRVRLAGTHRHRRHLSIGFCVAGISHEVTLLPGHNVVDMRALARSHGWGDAEQAEAAAALEPSMVANTRASFERRHRSGRDVYEGRMSGVCRPNTYSTSADRMRVPPWEVLREPASSPEESGGQSELYAPHYNIDLGHGVCSPNVTKASRPLPYVLHSQQKFAP